MLTRLSAWWAAGPSTRAMVILLCLAGIGLAVRWAVLAPMFSSQLGFLPFDLQPRMNRGMLVIQMGAARGHPLGGLYGAFVNADLAISLMLAFVTVVFWRRLHLLAPNRAYAFLTAGGIMLLPIVVAGLEMSEHRAVFGMLHQRGTDTFADAIDVTVAVHNLKVAAADLCNGITLVFMAATALIWIVRRLSAKTAPEAQARD